MRKNTTSALKGMGAVALALALTACGSGLSSPTTSSASSGSGSGSGSSGSTSTQVGTSLVELGNGVGATFANQALSIQVTNLAAGGTTGITATLVDANNGNALYTTQAVTVTFTSTCVAQGLAAFDTASVTSSTGQVGANYTAKGCATTDTVKATVFIGSKTLIATGQITVAAATLGSIQFLKATPTSIGLQGMGGQTSSKVTFQVNDTQGNPVPDAIVTFSLSTTLGGITLSPSTALTDATGQVSTFVQSGTQHTSVGVTAVTTSGTTTLTTGSSSIIVSTGIPTQNNFTIALASHNIEAWHITNVTDVVSVFLSDRFQNPVPDGTAVSITTDGGAIETGSTTNLGGCVTSNGTCTVNFRSQEAWPDPTEHPDFTILGHAHIFAYTIGEESFNDANGNGLFDSSETFYDLPEVFQDRNEDGTYHSATPTDYFYDFNKNNAYDTADGLWEGVLCNAGSKCSTNTTTGIGANECLVLSTSYANIGTASATTVAHTGGSVTFVISDQNGEVPAATTVISISSTNVQGVTLTLSPNNSSTSSYKVPDTGCADSRGTNWPKTFTVTATPTPGATAFGGTFQILVTSPSGAQTLSADIITII